jgi:asparagine synthase (glutamine-hydrolysing)
MLGEDAQQVWAGSEPDDEIAYIRAAFADSDGPTRLDQILNVDIETYLPDDLLVKLDRASMAHSMEARSPFLDHEFVEFAAQIPAKYKWRQGKKKWILKQAFENYIPETVQGRSKQGFSVPVDAWFRGELRDLAREKIERLGDRTLFDANTLENKINAHMSSDTNYGHHLWDLVVLEMWYERFID